MENVLRGLHWKTLLLYLDDIIVIATDFQTHVKRLAEVFERLRNAGLKLKPSKCVLLQKRVHKLGHIVSEEGVATDPEKVQAVADWPTPTEIPELRAFLGTVGYYRQYIPNFATLATPLNVLTGKTDWYWGPEQNDAFNKLRHCLQTAPILCYPDPQLQFILDTDARASDVGAVQSQKHGDKEGVIAYYSKTLSSAVRNYCTTR